MSDDFTPVGPKLEKALDPDTFHQNCDMCEGTYIPDINGDLLTCDACLYSLAFNRNFEVVSNKRLSGKGFSQYFFGES